MKRNVTAAVALTALLFVSFSTFAQEGLLVRNVKSGKTWMYEKNARVTYIRFHEDDYQTGVLHALLDSSVVLGRDTVPLKDIAGIRKKSPLHTVARVVGMPLMIIGSVFMGEGVASTYQDPHSSGGLQIFLAGAGIFALGYLPYQLNLADLTVGIGGEWKVEICRGCLGK